MAEILYHQTSPCWPSLAWCANASLTHQPPFRSRCPRIHAREGRPLLPPIQDRDVSRSPNPLRVTVAADRIRFAEARICRVLAFAFASLSAGVPPIAARAIGLAQESQTYRSNFSFYRLIL